MRLDVRHDSRRALSILHMALATFDAYLPLSLASARHAVYQHVNPRFCEPDVAG